MPRGRQKKTSLSTALTLTKCRQTDSFFKKAILDTIVTCIPMKHIRQLSVTLDGHEQSHLTRKKQRYYKHDKEVEQS